MKIVIETKDNKVFINGKQHFYGQHENISIEEKIIISIANELGFEPSELLNIPEVFGYH